MWKKWKESKLYYKLKQVRVNRAVYLSCIVILLALAVVLAITAATNRAKKYNADDEPSGTPQVTEPATQPTPPVTDDKPTGGDVNVPANTVPQLSLPVEGKLFKQHSPDVQVFSDTMKDFRVHLGIDIATEANAEVFAAADGTVMKIWEDPMMGWCIALNHSGDCVTVYKNLMPDMAQGLAEGSAVRQGQLLGNVGDSAWLEIADEPHLHMEMTVKGLQVNPLDYFSAAVIATLSEDTAFEQPTGTEK